MLLKPKGNGTKSRGVTLSASPTKPVRKAAGCNQAPAPLTQDLDETVTEEEPASSQVQDKLETMMNMLFDLSSRLQSIKAGLEERREKVTTCMLSTAASHVE